MADFDTTADLRKVEADIAQEKRGITPAQIDALFMQRIHGSAVAQNTEAYNVVFAFVQELKALAEESSK